MFIVVIVTAILVFHVLQLLLDSVVAYIYNYLKYFPDPFIKIKVYDDGDRMYTKRTSTQQDTTSPVFEESFDFVVTGSRMPQTSVMLRLYHHGYRANVLSKNVLIGNVFLGSQDQLDLITSNPFTLDAGATHWASIIERPHLTIEEWHTIREPTAAHRVGY